MFNQSDCSAPGGGTQYGTLPCDSYDDISATLHVVPTAPSPTPAAPVSLDRANGPALSGNSWPRWSPDHGTFRGKKLYWVAFSSRRPYGLQVNQKGFLASTRSSGSPPHRRRSALADERPQLRRDLAPRPEPRPERPNGSHVPVWVEKVVVIP